MTARPTFVPPTGPETDTPAEAYWRSLTWQQQDAIKADWLRDQQGFASSIEYAFALAGGRPEPRVGHIYGTGNLTRRQRLGKDRA